MFHPQPTQFSAFYSDLITGPIDHLCDQGLSVRDRHDSYAHPQQHDSFSGFQQPHFGAGAQSIGVGAGPSADSSGPSSGPDPGCGPVSGPDGQGHGGAVPVAIPAGVSSTCTLRAPSVATAPLSSFSIHSAIPHHQQAPAAGAPNLFDHKPSPAAHHLGRLRRINTVAFPSAPAAQQDMEQNPSLSDDLAAQEAAARTWQPELEGPRVGVKTPIDAIADEYAKADPIYVAKTMALPQTYTHYRPVKGDGNCGWRAIGFCYFELLIQQGSRQLIQEEELRLKQLNDYLATSGKYNPDIFMDFVEETMQLFKDVADNIDSPDDATAILISKFNDDASMNIIYHIRLLAASWLKGHRDHFEAWCETGIDGYCTSMIEPPDREIEELGIVLLVESLLKPVGFALEIAYLDRSAGTEANTHRFPDSDNSIVPIMHLLYRPGHYDILYKPYPTEVQVNRMSYEPTTFASVPLYPVPFDFTNPLAMLPGAGAMGPLSPMGQLGGPPMDYSPSPTSQWFPSAYADPSPTPPSQAAVSQQVSIPTPPMPDTSMSSAPTHEIRFSGYHYKTMAEPWPEQTFQTNMFKNSHFNKAHYNNPEFTPEEYKPGIEDAFEKPERPLRRKSHAKGASTSPDGSSGHQSGKKRQTTSRGIKSELYPDSC